MNEVNSFEGLNYLRRCVNEDLGNIEGMLDLAMEAGLISPELCAMNTARLRAFSNLVNQSLPVSPYMVQPSPADVMDGE